MFCSDVSSLKFNILRSSGKKENILAYSSQFRINCLWVQQLTELFSELLIQKTFQLKQPGTSQSCFLLTQAACSVLQQLVVPRETFLLKTSGARGKSFFFKLEKRGKKRKKKHHFQLIHDIIYCSGDMYITKRDINIKSRIQETFLFPILQLKKQFAL